VKSKKLIFLTSQPLNTWNGERFNASHLNKNFDFEYWNVSTLNSKNILIEDDKKYETEIKINNFHSYFSFIPAILKIPKDTYFIDISANNDLIFILLKNILFFRGIKFIWLDLGNHLETGNRSEFKTFFKKIFVKNYLISKILNKLNKISSFFIFYKYYHYFIGGLESNTMLGNIPKNKITYSHSLDYNDFFKLKNSETPIQKNYIVYLDQKYLDHPEIDFLKEPNYIEKNCYNYLKNFFENISIAQKKEVIFCAHPRAKNDDEYLQDFKNIKFNETAIYTKHADLVLAHDSISINYCIIFKKPLIIIIMPGMELSNKRDNLLSMGELLGCKVIDLKNFRTINLEETYEVDEAKYDLYIKKYIKIKGDEIDSWEILSKELCKL
jgi:hypothetical protein